MTRRHGIGLFVLCAAAVTVPAQTITTVAGNGTAGFSGDGGPAVQASFNSPVFVAVDATGGLLVADWQNHRVRRIDSRGVVTTIAGAGSPGFSGDGGPATQASFNGVIGLCLDAAGNIYVNDDRNNRIRRIDPAGQITTFAGNGLRQYGGDGGPATQASFNIGIRCATDTAGNVYVAEQGAHRIRKIAPTGLITTFAGNGTQGFSGDGGPAAAANLNNPTALTVDSAGNLYFSGQFNHRLRRVVPNGILTTIAGTGTPGFSGDGGPATSANLNFPGAMVADGNGDLYFTDGPNLRVRRVRRDGVIETVAGNGTRGFGGDGGAPLSASFNGEFGIAIDGEGNLYVADTDNHRVRKISGVAAGGPPPGFEASGVTAVGSLVPGVTPGALIAITGKNLTFTTAVAAASSLPLPERIGGSAVTFDGIAAPMVSARNTGGVEQLVVQAPFEIAGATVAIVVHNGRIASPPVAVNVAAAQPNLVTLDGFSVAAIRLADGALLSPGNGAAPGENIAIFARALGVVDPIPAAGAAAPADPLSRTVHPVELAIGGRPADVSFAGLAPGFAGLYQIHATVPAEVSGNVEVAVKVAGESSSPLRLFVKPPE